MLETAGVILALATFGYFLWDRYQVPSFGIDVDEGNIFLATLYAPGSSVSGNLSICLYGTTIFNKGRVPAKIKDIKLEYKYDNNQNISEHQHMITTVIKPGTTLESACVVTENPGGSLILMGWKNFSQENSDKDAVGPHGVLRFSTVFPLCIKESADLEKLSDFVFKFNFFGTKPTRQKFNFKKVFERPHKKVVIRREIFSVDANGDMIIPPL
jgi:hypothetical protein